MSTAGPVTRASVPSVRPDIRVRKIRGTLVVAVPEQAFELAETTAFIWKRIDGVLSVERIAELLAQEYEIDVETAVEDTVEVLAELVEYGAVRV
ncbi:PqqD family protein [Streptomyces sp. ISL-66]|uniref:PqqD family protein n=1 Tax=Streptomyces sp. ISL-66 TaxID=2819186 RepID=UPI001BE66131|nr:PqqD family protein [Streptomyces sp. ISL-66]MBT2470443.1 PqqD family protein [Streptomyces sp. ISL-66]